ncbi:hypothetical protein COTS27_01601 [Spirochaetota bacterium]|nr:hypothetical protein COTS27_01601 [Spirochaetota bacterium]
MKESLLKLKMMLFSLSTAVIIGACTVSTEPQRLTPLPPASISATFGGVTISTASTGASGVFIETDNTVVIRGFPNPPDELGVPNGTITIVPPTGVTVSALSLSFSDLTGSNAGGLPLTETVTVSSEGNDDNTFKVRIDFVAGTPSLVVYNSGGFGGDGIENNRLSLAKDSSAADMIANLSPCAYYAPDITFMLGTNAASINYKIASVIEPRPDVGPYFDGVNTANNTNAERFQVTYETNTGSLEFGFSVIVQDCSSPEEVFTPTNLNSPGTTAENPWIITDATKLQAMSFFVNQEPNDALSTNFFELANDIDLANFGGPEGFVPIGVSSNIPGNDGRSFAGRLDCKGRTISNLTINRPTSDFQGLFAFTLEKTGINGFIRNCRLTNVNVVGRDGVGGLVGDATSAIEISNVHLQGEVRGRNAVGGLIGRSDGARSAGTVVTNVSVHATVSGGLLIGGLIGYSVASSINASYFNGNVSGDIAVGGIIGHACTTTGCPTITNSYVRGAVTGFSAIGGLVGNALARSVNIKNSLSLMTVVGSNLDAALIDRYRTDSETQPRFERLETFRYNAIANTFATENAEASPSARHIGAVIGYATSFLPNNINGNYANSDLYSEIVIVSGASTVPTGITELATGDLQLPTAPATDVSATYYNWDPAVWNFGTETQYPVLSPPTDGVFTLEEQRTP